MKLTEPFLKLPIHFAAERLAAEVRALPQRAWMPHPQGFEGNEAVPLVSPNGELTNAFDGPMAPTEHLLACPHLMQAMGELGAVWGRGRLMALAPGAEVPGHVDIHYYWRTHYRVHIPVITNPGVEFTCGDVTVHMEAGDCWIPDTFRRHAVKNGGSEQRIHLVLDTVGGERFWEFVHATQTGAAIGSAISETSTEPAELLFEQINATPIMSPYELQYHLGHLCDHLVDHAQVLALIERLDRFVAGWTAAWSRFGPDEDGIHAYGDLIARAQRDVAMICGTDVLLDNGKTFLFFFERFLLANAISKQVSARHNVRPQPTLRHATAR